MPADSANRTLVLSVVAVDMVGYSRVSVAEQMSLKDNFNQALVRAIRHISIADRIILDTGDGVAMGFLGDPEDALYVAMFMQDAVNRVTPGIRIGINLGPVKLSTGVGGHPNIIGDGINVAERIMTFAEPGQCTVSRPFYELMSRMSSQYATLFEFAGVHTDKQVRAHDVYVMRKSADAFEQARQGVNERAAQRAGQAVTASMPPVAAQPQAAVARTPAKAPAAPTLAGVEQQSGLIDFLEDRKKVTTAATVLTVIAVGLGATLAYRMTRTMPADSSAPILAAASTATPGKDSGPAAVAPPLPPAPQPSPASVVAAKSAANVPVPKTETKSEPSKPTATVPAAAPLIVPAPPAKPAAPPAAVAPSTVRDKLPDPKTDKAARVEKSAAREPNIDAPRKPQSRTGSEREQSAPVTAAPVLPAYQAPVQAPRTESVAPTPSPAAPAPTPPAPAAASTEAVVVTRSAPPFPVEGVRQGLQTGFVKARLTIDARGNVSNVDILESKPIPAFGRETRNTLKDWKFNTGTPNRTYDIELSFKL